MRYLYMIIGTLTILKELFISIIIHNHIVILISLLFILSTMIGVLVSIYTTGFAVMAVVIIMWFVIPVDNRPLISIMFGLFTSLFIYVAIMLFTPDTYEKLAVMTHQNYITNIFGKAIIEADYNGEIYTITVPMECNGQYLIIYKKYEAKEFIDDFNLIASCNELDTFGKIIKKGK